MSLSAPKLIIFYGSSPGSGKSTLSSWLSKQLEGNGFNCVWIYEDDIASMEAFQKFIAEVKSNDPAMIETLLSAAEAFSTSYKDKVIVTDSIFPCFNWLIATGLYSDSKLAHFSRTLWHILKPLHPTTFYLDVAPELALKRAAKQRGDAWLKRLALTTNGYGRNSHKSILSLQDIVDYFEAVSSKSRRLLEGWGTVFLDAENLTPDELKQQVLAHLHLPKTESNDAKISDSQAYVGTYRSPTSELSIYHRDGCLYVDTYWPRGCELVPQNDRRFFLKDTSYYLEFDNIQEGFPQILIYQSPTETKVYQRIS